MDNSLEGFITAFSKAIKNNNAAIFAGAGLSIPAGFVNWKHLLRDIAKDLSLNIDKEHDLIAIAQYHFNEKGNNRHKLNQLLIEEFTPGNTITPNHKLLASLPINTYWTTNYDKLIEKALESSGKTPDVKITPANLSTNIPKRDAIVYKMHGDVSQPDEAILTKDDYEGYNEKRQLFTTTLQGDLISKTFLFIGFSFDDPNLEYILSRIRILLGQNQREHYCFFKRINRSDFNSQEDFLYAQIHQQLRVRDLKRYSINAVLIDDYHLITEALESVKKKILRGNIFISGAAKEFSNPWNENSALDFTYKLSYEISKKGFKIVTGVGLGIGRVIITGVLDHLFTTNYRHLDDALVLRPFPLNLPSSSFIGDRNLEYRKEILKNAGIALFLFGNKDDGTGGIKNSNGMSEEFEVALENNVTPIPIGITGYAAEELWYKVTSDPSKYYPDNPQLLSIIQNLGDKKIPLDLIIADTIKAIGILQEYYK